MNNNPPRVGDGFGGIRKFSSHVFRCVLAGLLAFSAACHHHHHQIAAAARRQPAPPQPAVPVGSSEEGMASWYGVPYHGRPAADGEIYDMEQLVAAHRTLPFNTWLKVTNLNNNRSVNVRVIDRGPFVPGRIIDLSKAAAREIEMLGPGVARVRLEVVSAPLDVPAADFYGVQIGAFAQYANAEAARAKYAERYGYAQISAKQGRVTLYRVLVGRQPTEAAAQQLASEVQGESGKVFVVRLDPENNGNRTKSSDNSFSPRPE